MTRLPQRGDKVLLFDCGEPWMVSSMRVYLDTVQTIGWTSDNHRIFELENGDGWKWRYTGILEYMDDEETDPPDDNEISDFLGLRS